MLKLSNNPKIPLPFFSASPSPSSQLSNNPTPPVSSTSSFEFTTVSLSPRKCPTAFNPADELFYKGQILPLQPSARISMLRALLLASSSASSSSDTTTTSSRDSSGNSNNSNSSFSPDLILLPECDSSRPSSVNEDDDFRRISNGNCNKKAKDFAKLTKFSLVFRKYPAKILRREAYSSSATSSVKIMSATAKEVLRKYLKKGQTERRQEDIPEVLTSGNFTSMPKDSEDAGWGEISIAKEMDTSLIEKISYCVLFCFMSGVWPGLLPLNLC